MYKLKGKDNSMSLAAAAAERKVEKRRPYPKHDSVAGRISSTNNERVWWAAKGIEYVDG